MLSNKTRTARLIGIEPDLALEFEKVQWPGNAVELCGSRQTPAAASGQLFDIGGRQGLDLPTFLTGIGRGHGGLGRRAGMAVVSGMLRGRHTACEQQHDRSGCEGEQTAYDEAGFFDFRGGLVRVRRGA